MVHIKTSLERANLQKLIDFGFSVNRVGYGAIASISPVHNGVVCVNVDLKKESVVAEVFKQIYLAGFCAGRKEVRDEMKQALGL